MAGGLEQLHCLIVGDAEEAPAIHLQDLVSYLQASALCFRALVHTTVDETRWIASSQIGETLVSSTGVVGDHAAEATARPLFYRGLAGSQVTLSSMVNQTRVMLEEQARHLLNEQERATMGYYLDEYKEGHISVDALVMALFELLNTHAKFSLLSEVRGVISPQDLDRFDNLVLKREIESMKVRQGVDAALLAVLILPPILMCSELS